MILFIIARICSRAKSDIYNGLGAFSVPAAEMSFCEPVWVIY